jgi:hypothetical protein
VFALLKLMALDTAIATTVRPRAQICRTSLLLCLKYRTVHVVSYRQVFTRAYEAPFFPGITCGEKVFGGFLVQRPRLFCMTGKVYIFSTLL